MTIKIQALTTSIKIVGFSRAYPDRITMLDFDGTYKTLTFNAEPELTADLEIEVESPDGRKTVHLADLPLDCAQETHLVHLLKWAAEQHRKSLLTRSTDDT